MNRSTVISVLLVAVFLTCAASPLEAYSICTSGVQNIVLTKDRTTYLTTPTKEADTEDEECSVQVRHNESNNSRFTILRLKVINFKLAGQDPCDPTQEHLKIVFGLSSAEESTLMWCGGSYAPVLETRQFMRLTYVRGLRGPGFNISFSLAGRFCDGGEVNLLVDAEPKYLYSPGYPNSYDLSSICVWSVTHANRQLVLVDSLKFALEYHTQCNYDYMSVDDNKFCGDQRVYTTSKRTTNTTILFVADHSEVYDGFVLRLVELPEGNAACTTTVLATTTPKTLRVPSLPQGTGGINCYWLVDAGSDDKVIFLDTKRFYTTATCHDFQLSVYNGDNANRSTERIVTGCAPQQMFQSIRSSGRYLYLDIDLINYAQINVDVEFTVTSSLRDAPPRVMYAGFAYSYVWMDLTAPEGLGILLRGTEDRSDNYSTCIHLSIAGPGRLQNPGSVNISDYIFAYSGWNETFMELGTACGQNRQEVISYGSKIFVKARQLGRAREWHSIWLRYSLERFCTPSSLELQASRSPQTLTSDRLPLDYPNNEYCRWVINPQYQEDSALIEVVSSQLFPDFCRDNVTVYEYGVGGMEKKLAGWCATQTPIIMGYAGGKLLVEFSSDAKLTDSGFTLFYSSVSMRNKCPTMTSIIASESKKNLSSPNYPFDYPNNLDCKWRITASIGVVEIKLLYLSIAQQAQPCALHDYLVIYDGPDVSGPVLVDLCGNGFIKDTFISTSISVLVHFRTDSETTSPGFQLQYSSTSNVDRFKCNKHLYVKDGESESISSPYYPNPYPQDTSCYWQVSAAVGRVVVLEVIDTDLPLCLDSVKVYDGDSANSPLLGKICNTNDQPRLTSSQQFMYITFTSTTPGTYKGFSFRLKSGQESLRCDGRVISLLAFPISGSISSPNYPRNYPSNANCKWRLESAYNNMTISLQFDDALLESSSICNFDSVSVYDGYDDRSPRLGRICADYTGVFLGSNRFLYVQFTSDSSSEYRGFHATYTAVPANELLANTDTTKSTNNTGAVVGGVLGGAVVLLVGFTLFLCYLKRSRRQRAQGSSPQRRRSHHNSDHNSTVYFMSPVIVNQMAPPPYPGLSNPAFDDVPAGYNLPPSLAFFAPPPVYSEVETPPPYCDTMILSHPPSSPGSGGSFDLSGVAVPPGFKSLQSSQSKNGDTPSAKTEAILPAHPEPMVMLLNPLRRQGQPAILQLSNTRPTSPGQLPDSRPMSPGQFSDSRSVSPSPITSMRDSSPTQAQPASQADAPAVLEVTNGTYV